MVCYRHPTKETTLRCNRCDKPICAQCARRTPTGYRCPDCIREMGKVFVTARWYDYITAFLTAMILALIAALLVGLLGSGLGLFFIFIIVAAATAVGSLIAEAVRRVVGKRRARPLFITATAGVVVGGLIPNLPLLVTVFLMGELGGLLALLWPGVFIFLAASTTYVRLSGIQIGR
jgi:hypothetical protein